MAPTGKVLAGDAAAQANGDDALEQLVWYIGRAYYSYVGLLELVLAETGLDKYVRPGMGHILFALFERDQRSIKEIAARVQLSSSTMTGLLTRMEQSGLIKRRRDHKDGRIVRIHLTALGRSLEPRCRLVVRELSDLLHAGMGEKAVRDAKRLLRKMTQTMRAEEQRKLEARSS